MAGASERAPLAVVVLAAGQGTRMKSSLPKTLHKAAGRTLLEHILRATAALAPERTVVVVGEGEDQVRASVTGHQVSFVTQDFSTGYGTGHALKEAGRALSDFAGDVMVLNGDGPLLKSETLSGLAERQRGKDGMTLITCLASDPTGMGRIIRDDEGNIAEIVEEKEATPEQRTVNEVNPGIYIFDATVFEKAERLPNDNAAGEYYITDLPGIYLQDGKSVRSEQVEDETEVLAVNDREQLAQIEAILRERVRERLMKNGVTLHSPETTFVDDEVVVESDVILEPGVILKGRTNVATGVTVGAYAYLENCTVAEGAQVAPHTVARDEEFV